MFTLFRQAFPMLIDHVDSLILNSLSCELLICILLGFFTEVLSCFLVWNIFLCFFIFHDSLRCTLLLSATLSYGCILTFVIVQAGYFIFSRSVRQMEGFQSAPRFRLIGNQIHRQHLPFYLNTFLFFF